MDLKPENIVFRRPLDKTQPCALRDTRRQPAQSLALIDYGLSLSGVTEGPVESDVRGTKGYFSPLVDPTGISGQELRH